LNDNKYTKYLGCSLNSMTAAPPAFITLDDDEKIIEPGFVSQEEFQRVIAEGAFVEAPGPLEVVTEPVGETTRELPGVLATSPSGELLKQYITWEGFGDHHIEVYDNWIFRSAYNNVYSRMLAFPDGRSVCFENLKIFHPRYTRDGKVLPLTPKLAREQGVTYGGDWHADVVLRRDGCGGPEIDRRVGVCIGTVPTMLKSRNCILHGRTPRELALFGEDPKDPGGYFVVSGVEKVILLQEQLAVNKIFLMKMDSKGSTVARMTANTTRGTALIELALDKKTRSVLKIRFPSMRGAKQGEKYKSINVLRVFRLFGAGDPNQIQGIISFFMKPDRVKKSMFKLTRNLVDFLMFRDDVEIIASKMDKSKATPEEKLRDVTRVLDTDLFPHLNNLPGPDNETVAERETRIATAKIYLLAIMIARFLEHLAGFQDVDNRDAWANKRLEGAGRMMEQLFRNAWRKTLGIVQAAIESGTVKDLGGVVEKIRYSVITDTFHDSFVTSNWGVKGTQMKNNVAQTLVRDSVVATFAHINTVDVALSRTDRQQAPRLVQMDQWFFVCPAATSEGENAGILKNLAITTKISLERSDVDIIRLLIGDPAKGIPARVSADARVREQWPDKLIVNGKFLGWCNGNETRDFLVNLRRTGALFLDASIVKEGDWLYVDISPSRVIRPVLIVDPDQQLAIDRIGLRGQPNHILLTNGAMEYVSAWEQHYIKIATSVAVIAQRLKLIEDANETYRTAAAQLAAVQQGERVEIIVDGDTVAMSLEDAQSRVTNATEALEKLQKNRPYTHCELDPQALLGVAAALIPWPNHNQAPRNTYQVNMGKQALGVYHSNHLNRFDGKTKILAFPNRPIVETEMYDILGLDERGPGENVVVAFMAFPYTEEDSFVVKKEFLDNGGSRIYKYLTYKTVVKHSGDVTEELTRPEPRPGEPSERYKYIQMFEKGNPNNGLPMIGAPLKQGDCVIGKMQHVPATKDLRNESVILRVGDEGVVEKVLVTSDNKTTIVTVKLRVMRVPQEGDKFAPRNAQKGTIGLVMSDIDLPVTEDGITPDFIVNPHSMPSRMTMEYPMELLAAKHGIMRGIFVNAGAFKPFEMDKYRQTMRDYDMHEFGYEKMRSGSSGKPLQALIYCGPVFFQALRHHVKDKAQVRSTGQVKPMTRQPPKGRGNRGGLRFGEMERDAAISHGASAFLRERLMFVSDAYQTAFCKTCGTFAVNDAATRRYKPCRLCGDDENFGRCTIPYAYKLLIHLLAAPGLFLRPEFATMEEYAEKLFRQRGPVGGAEITDIHAQLLEADEALAEEQEEFADEGLDTDYADVYD
jgi:DNA-directed RNA polymerase beta subunit